MTDPRIGTFATEEHGTYWPAVTITGRPYTPPASLYRGIGNGQFVVLESSYPRGYDVEAVIAELVKPPKKKAAKTEDSE